MGDDIFRNAALNLSVGGAKAGATAGAAATDEAYGTDLSSLISPNEIDIPGQQEVEIPPLPQPNDAAVRQSKKRSIAAMRARRGRASTILTADTAISDALGG